MSFDLPSLSDEETQLLSDMRVYLAAEIEAAGGALTFDRYMEAALYAPGLGYYVNGRRKLGAAGDFTTAPEISPLFGRCLATQVSECLRNLGGGDILEIGAGSGRLAVDLLSELERLDALPESYLILDLSPSLRAMQADTLARDVPHLLGRVQWLDSLPSPGFKGVVVANELLDAMPVQRFRGIGEAWQELVVVAKAHGFEEHWSEVITPGLGDALESLRSDGLAAAEGYSSEVNLRLKPWLAALRECMAVGYLLLIDYGYTRGDYYHADRTGGTLMCHFRHRAHTDALVLPGLQDITANVDFTAVAEAASEVGMTVAGYTTQAHFLIGTGLDNHLAEVADDSAHQRIRLMQGVKQLTLPSEMGERFKAMGLALDSPEGLSGFATRDLRDRL